MLLACGLAGMILCWVYPWSVLVGLWARPVQPRALLDPVSTIVLLVAAAAMTHFLARRSGAGRRSQIMSMAVALVAVFVVVSVDHQTTPLGLLTALAIALGQPTLPALAFALGLYLWWRGARLGTETATFSDVEGAFRWGIGLLAVFALILGLTTRPSLLPALESATAPFVVGFFFISLLTLALGRLESLRTRTRAISVNGQWVGALIAVAGAVILLALVVSQLLSFDLLLVAAQPVFELLRTVIILIIYAVVIPLAYVMQLLAFLLLQLLHPGVPQQPPQPLQPAAIDEMLRRLFGQSIPPEAVPFLKAVGVVLLVALALLLVARAVSRWRPAVAESDLVEEERESVWRARGVRHALVEWLRKLFLRRTRRAGAGEVSGDSTGAPAARGEELSSVRAIYRQLLRLGESVGTRRRRDTTAFEHLAALQRSLEPAASLAQITDSYVRARYADESPQAAEVEHARHELELLEPRADDVAQQPAAPTTDDRG